MKKGKKKGKKKKTCIFVQKVFKVILTYISIYVEAWAALPRNSSVIGYAKGTSPASGYDKCKFIFIADSGGRGRSQAVAAVQAHLACSLFALSLSLFIIMISLNLKTNLFKKKKGS